MFDYQLPPVPRPPLLDPPLDMTMKEATLYKTDKYMPKLIEYI